MNEKNKGGRNGWGGEEAKDTDAEGVHVEAEGNRQEDRNMCSPCSLSKLKVQRLITFMVKSPLW